MNVQFPQTVRATVIGAGRIRCPCPGAPSGWRGSIAAAQSAGGYPAGCRRSAERLRALTQLDLAPRRTRAGASASLPVRYATLLTVIDALLAFVARFPNPRPLLLVAEQDFGKALGMLRRPQLPHLPLAVIDEVSIRAGDYIDIGTPLLADRLCR